MELWIRSQNKECLMKVNRIDMENTHIICYDNDYHCNETYMGQYATKERALEILDEIQRLITDLQYMSYAVDSSSFYSYRPNVYEMPKE